VPATVVDSRPGTDRPARRSRVPVSMDAAESPSPAGGLAYSTSGNRMRLGHRQHARLGRSWRARLPMQVIRRFMGPGDPVSAEPPGRLPARSGVEQLPVRARVDGRVQRGVVCCSNHDPRRASGHCLNLRQWTTCDGARCGDRTHLPAAGVGRHVGDRSTCPVGAHPPLAGAGEGDRQRCREASSRLASRRSERANP
jgi:hypothetical protein